MQRETFSHYSLARFEDAEDDLKKALALSPEHGAAHLAIGKNYAYMKKEELALWHLDAAVACCPSYEKTAKCVFPRQSILVRSTSRRHASWTRAVGWRV